MGRTKAKIRATERADGRLVRTFKYDNKRYYVYGYSTQELDEKERAKRESIRNNSFIRNKDYTFSEYVEVWKSKKLKVVKESTVYYQSKLLTPILKMIGNYKIKDITRYSIEKVRDELMSCEKGNKKPYTTTSINSAITLIGSIMNCALQDEIIEKNPCANIKPLKKKDSETNARDTIHRALTKEEQKAFFDTVKEENNYYYNLFCFLVNTGCRIGEVISLTWNDVNTEKNYITIARTLTVNIDGKKVIGNTPKTKTSKRIIPLNPTIRYILNQQKKQQVRIYGFNALDGNEHIFTSSNGKIPYIESLESIIERICKKANIERFSLHAFRATFATSAIEHGMKPNTLKEILGHSSISMTMDLYSHVMEDTKQNEMNLINIAL